jgi:hypothetical protein
MASFRVRRKTGFLLAALHFCLAALLAMASPQSAGAITISGIVTDSITGSPLSGVIVQAVGSFDQFVTDDQGRFSLSATPTAVSNSRFISGKADFRLTGRAIEWDAAASMKMKLYSLRGELLDKYSAGAGPGSRSLPSLTSGIFLIESLIDGNKHNQTARAM